MKIHENVKEARQACERYTAKLGELQESEGVSEECEDSCASVYVTAKYYDKEGNVKTYLYD